MDPLLIRGILALGFALMVLAGSVYLLLSLVLGPKLAYAVTGSVFFGILVLLSTLWVAGSLGLGGSTQKVSLGPKGPDTIWEPAGAGPSLNQAKVGGYPTKSKFTGATETGLLNQNFDVAGYPDSADWKSPATCKGKVCPDGTYMADLSGADDTASEKDSVKPVMEALIANAIDPAKKPTVQRFLQRDVGLKSGEFQAIDIRFKEVTVEGKASLIAVGRAVPIAKVTAAADQKDGTVDSYLVKPGDKVIVGQSILNEKTDSGTIPVASSSNGTMILQLLRTGDKVKPNTPVVSLDISGQPGTPQPVEVASVRIRGSLKMPAFIYLLGSLVLFALHMGLLSRVERTRKVVAQTA